jgi:hypothetical protein
MKYYKKIEIDYYDDIVADTLSYLKNQKPDIYNRKIDATYYVLDLDEFKKFCPKLDLGFARYDLICNYAVAFVMHKTSDVKIHIDNYRNKNVNARINIPILNTHNTFTTFYTGGIFTPITNPLTKITALRLTGIDELKLVDKVEIDKPTVIRVNEPHNIHKLNSEIPRITLTLGFDKDPVFLLED